MASFRNAQFTCSCCGRECKFKDMKHGICKQCLNVAESDDIAPEVYEELRSPAEDHDRAYNGTELDEVDYDDISFD